MNIQDALLRGLMPAGRPDAGVPARPLTERTSRGATLYTGGRNPYYESLDLMDVYHR